jgi:trehalose 6-phosphate synthase
MSRLIVISNRVSPPSALPGAGSQGGLAVAIAAALREYRGIWFGWSGQRVPEFTGSLRMQRVADVTTALVDLEEQDVDEYYNGYANETLWPLFHYRVDLTEYDRSFSTGYARVNCRFAEAVLPLIEPEDMIWVHDYHLIPLATELRRKGCKNRIGFFLHIPWPPRRLLTTLPQHEELVAALFDYDLVGFQTVDWLEAFREYAQKELDAELGDDGTVTAFGRRIKAQAFPIGIDAEEFADAGRSEAAAAMHVRMRESLGGRRMLVGVDRLDYSKGLEERFSGYERLLANDPSRQGQVFMLQIAPPTREEIGSYQEIRGRLDALSGRINGAFADVDWVPIRYVNRGYSREELAGIYRAAALGLVTPLRDGMNLVAKEYVAAQDPEAPGALVLSRFAGAALQMPDAILINPYSQEEIADGIARGLDMPLPERKRRWETLMHTVQTEDVVAWRNDFVAALQGPGAA